MTRRVRSGSSQKHKKMPGDATKWGEFDNQHARELQPRKKKKNIKSQRYLEQTLKISPSNSLGKAEESLNADFFDENKYTLVESLDNLNEQENGTFGVTHSNITPSHINNEHADSRKIVCDPEIKKKMKNKKKSYIKYSTSERVSDEINFDEIPRKDQTYKKIKLENSCPVLAQDVKISKQDDNSNDFTENNKNPEGSFFQHDKMKRKKKKIGKSYNKNDSESLSVNNVIVETSLSDNISFDNSNKSTSIKQNGDSLGKTTVEPFKSFQNIDSSSKEQKMNSDSNQSSVNNESSKKSSSENKKEKYLRKLQKKREKLGLLLLPNNVETKLHKIKKRLMEKGLPPEKQKEIMRQARRKEELKYRKVFNPSKLCFGCREAGHVLAHCPKKSESLKQETGICFKCGSVEHTSHKCPNKFQILGFPYANCFICKEQGHISRDCPKNKHGVYPKGGRCKLCGNVNHLKKDCPTLNKNENEEENITLHTLDAAASIDAEMIGKKEIKEKAEKKEKIVKF